MKTVTSQEVVRTEEAVTGSALKKGVYENFAIFKGKHPCWSIFLKKLQTLRTAIY